MIPRVPARAAAASLLAALLGLAAAGAAGAAEVSFRVAGGNLSARVESLADLRFRTVVRQAHDFSCGAAALATLLRFHYETDVSERELVDAMMAAGDPEKIRTQGFSMGDMQRFLAGYGIRANGYWAKLEDVAKAGVPVIALISLRGYRHFVVVKGVRRDDVLVGDPALGLRTYRTADFEAMREGPLFAVDDHLDTGRRFFNDPAEWRLRPRAIDAAASARPGRTQLLTLRPAGEF